MDRLSKAVKLLRRCCPILHRNLLSAMKLRKALYPRMSSSDLVAPHRKASVKITGQKIASQAASCILIYMLAA